MGMDLTGELAFRARLGAQDDLVAVADPKWARLETVWKGRGGIRSNITVEHCDEGYAGPQSEPFA